MDKVTQFKVILLGDASTGKSSIIHRFIMSKFKQYPEATLGTAFFSKIMCREEDTYKLNVSGDNRQIWDTSGEEKFRSLTSNYYKGNH